VGWDAFACIDGERIEKLPEVTDVLVLFQIAAKQVQKETDNRCDAGLWEGALFNSNSQEMLTKATGEDWYGGDNELSEYSPDQIQEFARNANWNFRIAEYEKGTYHSAQEFLRLCAENNLGVHISY
jgi:hypothetical protein